MADFSESLTIRILGDSSHFQSELGQVVSGVTDLQSRLASVGELQDVFSRLGEQVGQMSRPLLGVSNLLTRIGQQLVVLTQSPVTLNVVPAAAGLQFLSQMIDWLMLKLRQLAAVAASAASFSGAGAAGGAVATGVNGPVRQFANGGLVEGRSGVDQVPAMLTAGEFVLRKPIVQNLGPSFLRALNQSGFARGNASVRNSSVESQSRTDIHQYGGFTFNVSQPMPLEDVMKTLQHQRARLRNRRG